MDSQNSPLFRAAPPRGLLAALLLACILLPAAGFLGGCAAGDSEASEGSEEAAEEDDAPKTVPVEVVRLERGPIESVLRFSTNLEAEQSVGVYSQAARRVTALLVEEGDRVAAGQVLVRLQDDEQQTQISRVEGQLAKARREYERQKKLYEDDLISEQAFNEATYELEQLRLQQDEAERQLSYTAVRAPISGTITRRLINLGDHVTLNQHLFDLVDFDSLVARVYVPEKELARLDPGLPARITVPALGGAEYRGRVERLAPVVDPQSGTIKVTVGIPDWRGLRPGLYVDVALVTDTHDEALLVPKRALVYDQEQTFVYRLRDADADADPTVERVRVRPALEAKEVVEPAGDVLAPGDRVVIAGQAGLKDGAAVRVLDVPTSGADAAGEPQAEPGR